MHQLCLTVMELEEAPPTKNSKPTITACVCCCSSPFSFAVNWSHQSLLPNCLALAWIRQDRRPRIARCTWLREFGSCGGIELTMNAFVQLKIGSFFYGWKSSAFHMHDILNNPEKDKNHHMRHDKDARRSLQWHISPSRIRVSEPLNSSLFLAHKSLVNAKAT